MARGRKATVIFVKRAGKLVPASAWDEEQFQALPDGTEVDVISRTKRSNPQMRLYWAGLACAVEATDLWPTSIHLHDALLRDLGYFQTSFDTRGNPYLRRDSAAFDAMSDQDFNRYFDRARTRLVEALGFDPWEALDERAAA